MLSNEEIVYFLLTSWEILLVLAFKIKFLCHSETTRHAALECYVELNHYQWLVYLSIWIYLVNSTIYSRDTQSIGRIYNGDM